jgi:16S rRNA (uracil1498-N3)-methyltransferase
MARFFVLRKNIQGKYGIVNGRELRHLRRVLRLRTGDRITVFDDTGWEHQAIIRSFGSESAEIEIFRSYEAQQESALDLTLALGLTKGDKMDFVVEKATELGIRRIIPFASAHAVTKFDAARAEKRTARWQKIALSAAKQSGRGRVPEILPPTEFRELIAQGLADGLKLLFWEKETSKTLNHVHAAQPAPPSVVAVIGPEGGFSDEESALATEHGFYAVSLGRRILRAETAAVVALTIVQFLWGDLGQQSEEADC